MKRRNFLKTTAAATAGSALFSGQALAQQNQNYTTTDLTIESWDGIELAATVFEPKSEGSHPAMLMTHGWGGSRSMAQSTASMYANNGYVVLTYDSRGFGNSGGLVRLDGPKEQKDASRLIDWLANRDSVETEGENNPRVGMDGVSYAGGIQLLTAARDQRLDAVVPRITWHTLKYSLGPNDAIKIGWLTLLFFSGGASSRLSGELGKGL
ncbi:MAG: CocE/NonD family hydrolase, partial [Halobacteria archaeon]|nr:CocE/NonD family hydrolase [Halobacteria archaeon]